MPVKKSIQFISFFVGSDLFAFIAVFFQYQLVFGIQFISLRDIILAFAHPAFESQGDTVTFFCHIFLGTSD